MLSDVEIRQALQWGSIVLDPPPFDKDIQPASIDVHIGRRFGRLQAPNGNIPYYIRESSKVEYAEADELVFKPGDFILAQLAEKLTIDASIVARVEGKSSIGRKGVGIHVTAGFVDPGWNGYLTLEMFNASKITYIIKAGDPIAQLAFDRLSIRSARPYGSEGLGSHYQDSEGTQGSLL